MFKPCRILKYSVLTLKEDSHKLLELLHESGFTEITSFNHSERELDCFPATEGEKFASFNLTKVKRARTILSAFAPKKSISEKTKSFLGFKKTVRLEAPQNKTELEKIVREKISPVFEKAEEIDRELKEATEVENSLKQERSILKKLRGLNIDLEELQGFKNVEIIIGRVPKELKKKTGELIRLCPNAQIVKEIHSKYPIVILAVANEKSDELMGNLRKNGFERIVLPKTKGRPARIIKAIEKSIVKTKKRKATIEKQAEKLFCENKEMLNFTEEVLRIEKERHAAFISAGQTEKTVNIDFFVPEKKEKEFLAILGKSTNERFHAEKMNFEESEAPILLNNPVFFRDYEFILKLYGLPEYNSFDPTFLIAIAYPLFFGLAFSDIGYGIMLTVLAIALRLTWGRTSKEIRHLMNILFHGGLTTIFFGWMFGSFFGDMGGESIKKMALLDPLGKTATGESAAMIFLGIMAGIGLIHLNIALIIGFAEELRKRHYKEALTEKFVFIILQTGLLCYTAGVFFGYGEIATLSGMILVVSSFLILFIGGGPLGMMKVTGFLGNTLSYLRLAALSLATFAVAMSINIIAGIIGSVPLIGFALAAIVLVFGHIANFIFNILSSFIHPLRLHFVEFFSYFYEGAGREFSPFSAGRKLTQKRRWNR